MSRFGRLLTAPPYLSTHRLFTHHILRVVASLMPLGGLCPKSCSQQQYMNVTDSVQLNMDSLKVIARAVPNARRGVHGVAVGVPIVRLQTDDTIGLPNLSTHGVRSDPLSRIHP